MDENLVDSEYDSVVKNHPGVIRRIYDFTSKGINYKVGALSGFLIGGINAFINSDYGALEAAVVFRNQFFYNLLIGGFNTRICQYIATNIPNRNLAIGTSTVSTTAFAFGATYLSHLIGGSQDPLLSSTWQIPLNGIASAVLATGFRLTSETEQGLIENSYVQKFSKYFSKLK
ncbi:hypothetical protein HQ533_03025 [Candidatus Woesearchaeota archaeon]|nr:hypothetical protein [Candidatus Woesearchaeota archaeon]